MLNTSQAQFILETTNFCLTHSYLEFNGDFYLRTHGTAMGANFAPSYANLTIGLWENWHIWNSNPFTSHLIFYDCYIDDVIIIWDVPKSSVQPFVAHCNANDMGLSFTSICDENTLAFLALTLSHHNGTTHSQNYTKPTAGNSYLHYKSCHHRHWIKNIPKSQYCLPKHNCAKDKDYVTRNPPTLIDEAFKRSSA